MQEARFYEKLADEKVHCHLCAHECKIDPGKRGICMVRENQDGGLYSLVYGRIVSGNVDPSEKKTLFHFLPGTRSYSIATVGCNFQCLHCQNYDISQYPRLHKKKIIGEDLTPKEVVSQARATHSASVAYTYTEPTIFAEFAYDTAAAINAGLKLTGSGNRSAHHHPGHNVGPGCQCLPAPNHSGRLARRLWEDRRHRQGTGQNFHANQKGESVKRVRGGSGGEL